MTSFVTSKPVACWFTELLETITMTTPRLHLPYAAALRRQLTAGFLAAGLPAVALAHPGDHGSDWLHAAMHLLSEPDHLGMVLLAIAAAVWGVRLLRRRGRRGAASDDH